MSDKKSAAELAQQFRPLDMTQLPPDPVDDELPPEFESAPPPPQPQRFTLKLPADMTNCWELLECKVPDPSDPSKQVPLTAYPGDDGKRIALRFDGSDVLTIVGQARGGPGGRSYVGEPLFTRIDARERNRAKKTEPQVMVSDIKYLLSVLYAKELENKTMKLPRNGDNATMMQLLVQKAGALFSAEWEWSGRCNPDKQAYVLVGTELVGWVNVAVTPNVPVNGCGARVYQSAWLKTPDGWWAERMKCPGLKTATAQLPARPDCAAQLRPFGSLRRFKPVVNG